jgi:hypothetical protein
VIVVVVFLQTLPQLWKERQQETFPPEKKLLGVGVLEEVKEAGERKVTLWML